MYTCEDGRNSVQVVCNVVKNGRSAEEDGWNLVEDNRTVVEVLGVF
jgi:hypothetical protein